MLYNKYINIIYDYMEEREMTWILAWLPKVLEITLLDFTLSGDNVGLIALAIKNLPPEVAKKANFVGVCAAVGLRILFVCIVGLLLSITWLPIKLIGGIILLYITWGLLKKGGDEEATEKISGQNGFWKAIMSIVIADASMSLDNVLAIAAVADGNVLLVVFGLALCIPIIFFGSRFVAAWMKKFPIIIYLGGAILVHTAFEMILEDHFIHPYVYGPVRYIPIIVAVGIIFYGMLVEYVLKKSSAAMGR